MQERLITVSTVVQLSELERGPNFKRTVATENKLKKALYKLDTVSDLSLINEKYSDNAEIESIKRVISHLSEQQSHSLLSISGWKTDEERCGC